MPGGEDGTSACVMRFSLAAFTRGGLDIPELRAAEENGLVTRVRA
jgi:hypothetical protein